MGEAVIEDVLRRLGIEGRRKGREWTALCPNKEHKDREPSWRIRDEPGVTKHGMHHCWPCGFGGTLEDLVIYALDVPWREAKEWLSGGAVEIDRPVAAAVDFKVRSPDRSFRLPAGVEFGNFETWPSSARKYAQGRGITAEQVNHWGIGYSVEGRLAGRVIFPKRDNRGDFAGYSARTFVDAEPRYKEAEPWEKPRPQVMFGEQHWPLLSNRHFGKLYVLEGAINALAVERAADYPCHVAVTSGSQLYPIHAAKLSVWGEIVLVTDPDDAGDKLAATIGSALARHVVEGKIRRVTLPKGQDAASLSTEQLAETIR